MKILILHAIERTTLNLLIDAGIKRKHSVMLAKLNQLDVYDGRVFYNEYDIANFDIVFFREIRKNTDTMNIVVNYLKEKKVKVIDRCIANGKNWNKVDTYLKLYHANISYPKTMFIANINERNGDKIKGIFNFPIIMKPINGQQGEGISLIKNKNELEEYIHTNIGKSIMIQEFIENDGDIRVFIVGDKILGAIKRTAKEGEFRNNVALGGTATQVKINEKIEKIAISAAKVLEIDIAGVDIIFDKNNNTPYILEVNRSPEFGGFIDATGINVAEEIITYLENKGKSL